MSLIEYLLIGLPMTILGTVIIPWRMIHALTTEKKILVSNRKKSK